MALKLSSQVGLRMGVQASGYAPVKGGSSEPPVPPDGFVLLTGSDGAYLIGADGAYLYGRAA